MFRDTKRYEHANAALAKSFAIIKFDLLTACWIDSPRQARRGLLGADVYQATPDKTDKNLFHGILLLGIGTITSSNTRTNP
jgi:hypothetical protein